VRLLLYELGVFEHESVTLSTVNICTQNTSAGISNEEYCGIKFSKKIRRLFICGNIVSDKYSSNYYEDLNIYVYHYGELSPLYKNIPGEKFSKGKFCEEVLLPTDIESGIFTVRIYYFRDLVAETQFELR
jgi:hypothetical protein